MKALQVFAIYVTPFLIIAAAIKLLMKRYAVDVDLTICPKAGLQTEAQISARSLVYRRIGRPIVDGPLSWTLLVHRGKADFATAHALDEELFLGHLLVV